MILETKTVLQWTPWLASGLVILGVAACDARPPAQASRNADEIVANAPGPAAGKRAAPFPTESVKPAKRDAAQPPEDVAINIRVQNALKSNFSLKALPILAQTSEGEVALTASVDTPASREQAMQAAQAVAGVKSS